jgi:hypothetical protein
MKENKKLKPVDVVILLCAIIIIAVGIMRSTLTGYIASEKNLDPFTVAFVSDGIPNSYIGNLKSGETVEWVEKGIQIGKISSIDAPTPAPLQSFDSEGKLLITESDTASLVSGTLSVLAANRDGCFISGTEFIGAGMKITLRTENTVFTVTVLSVKAG